MALRLHGWPTPNVLKVSILVEELGQPFELVAVNIREGEQRSPEFLRINPNGKVPVVVDEMAPDGPIVVVESGAILIYLRDWSARMRSRPAVERGMKLMAELRSKVLSARAREVYFGKNADVRQAT